ncbi:MAG: SMP-30/gluconolactonase/LRE family protein [Actinomycetia bacterium]|nr:SMP-30/gluconolactonase/LRE family protein [Actinomycetes bacterium]
MTPTPQIDCVVPADAQLGESPVWDGERGVLWWVDINGRAIHQYDPVAGEDRSTDVPRKPAALAVRSGGGLVVATDQGFHGFSPEDGSFDSLAPDPEPDLPSNRLNDSRCDRQGRFWAGSMHDPTSAKIAEGRLHRLDPDLSVTTFLEGLGVSNGLAFSPDGRTMYHADTWAETVWAYDYDPDEGVPRNRRVFAEFFDVAGRPDGATVDESGCYWVALVRGGQLARVNPRGELDRLIPFPVTVPTMPAFGGALLDTMFVTCLGAGAVSGADARPGIDGGLFAFDPGCCGLPEPTFAG